MVTASILFPSVQVPPPSSSLVEYYQVHHLPQCRLSFIISYWVILKYACLGIGQISEVDFSCLHLPLFLCGGKAALWYVLFGAFLAFTHFLILLWFPPSSLSLPCQVAPPHILFVTSQMRELCNVCKWLCNQVISNFPFGVNCFALKMDHHWFYL
jgi:hypothetical protein